MTMRKDLFRIAMLSLAVASAGCTNKDTEGPDTTAPTDNNAAPIAEAGADKIASAGQSVTLNGSGSDSDGTVTGYNWSQVSGPSVTLDAGGDGTATFTAPQTEEATRLEFELRVGDDGGATSEADPVTVTVWPQQDRFFGTATENDDDYLDLLTYFDQVTPGNAGKWGSVEATRDHMDWTGLDTAHDFAKNHNLRYKHHTLFWGQQQPGWLADLSVEEQRAEIGEWLVAVRERYAPDEGMPLDMIDVVNEPLHAPPAYKEALGGDGETGWDWLITAFELAREHFPDSKLILNDYNILNLEENSEDYLMVVKLLRDLDLLDGIGVQAHFLEQVSGSEVQRNLDLLASAGLPIYISELDVNYADDARQANKLRQLFSIFWNHPAVAGVTHWGYREGATWRENAWLLNSDDTERPALAWLNCYLQEFADSEQDATSPQAPACDHLVPEYTPAGWAGDESGVTLEAELFDRGEGLLASGNIISNVDVGDWIAFQGVEFRQGWDGLKVRYAKGGDTTGRISVRLDCDNINSCSEVASVPLPPTGGWNTFSTVDIDWAPMDDGHDVYLRFMDVANVGNIDWLRFLPSAVTQVNLVEDGGFEGDTIDSGWSIWYTDTGELALTDMANSGSQGLSLSGRTNTGANRASYDLTGKVETGVTYPVSARVTHSGPDVAPVTLSYKLRCNDVPDEESTYHGIDANSEVTANEWTQLSGELEIPADCGVINEVRIYFENTPLDVETLYYDDVEVLGWGISAPEPEEDDNLVNDGGFEGDSLDGNWSAWYTDGTVLGLTSERFQSGTGSLKVSNRQENSNPSYNLTGKVENGQQYPVSAWVFHTGADAEAVTLSAKLACTDGEQYPRIFDGDTEDPLPANQWVRLEGVLEIPAGCDASEARLYFEGTPLDVETLYIDDLSVLSADGEPEPEPEPEPDNLIPNGGFEDNADGWGAGWAGGEVARSTEQASAGNHSLKANGFGDSGAYAAYMLTDAVTAPATRSPRGCGTTAPETPPYASSVWSNATARAMTTSGCTTTRRWQRRPGPNSPTCRWKFRSAILPRYSSISKTRLPVWTSI
ncbi:endo-1,4-beta-xylanase [Microbulbifer litoralis]|uniref:endo-1,4-beta-xylanase n=1 Tax=Microbulbifer litoralis TaxID=2933965 RepID=UPI002028C922|nr:endo-1,4-beta-xylanase [Microbulbifer sp. GX H0434]